MVVTDLGSLRGLKRKFAAALIKTKGVVAPAARLCEISGRSHWRWIKEDPHYAEVVEHSRRDRLDSALMVVLANMSGPGPNNLKAAMFVLENEGQSIGYGLKPGTAIQVNTAVNTPPGMVDVSVLKKYLVNHAEEKEKRFSQVQAEQTNAVPPGKHGFSDNKTKGER